MGIDWEHILDADGVRLAEAFDDTVANAMYHDRHSSAATRYTHIYPVDDQIDDATSTIDELDDRDGL